VTRLDRLYPPTGNPPVEAGIKLGTKLDRDRRTAYTFTFEDGVRRSFYHLTEEQALQDAKLWGLAHGRIGVQEGL